MVNSINSSVLYFSLTQSNSTSTTSSALSSDEMFKKLTSDVGGDGKTVTKDQLESYISKLESDTSNSDEKGKLGFLKQLDANWDKVSNGSDSITSADLAAGMSYLQPPTQMGSQSTSYSDSTTSLFSSLSDAVGASSNGVTKSDLTTYLKSLLDSLSSSSDSDSDSDTSTATDSNSSSSSSTSSTSSTSKTSELASEISLLTNLLANFDSLSNANGYITADSLKNGLKEPQDPSTVTSSQLEPPIDLRV